MAIYQQSVFKPAPLKMQTGVLPIYLFGSFEPHPTPFKFTITAMAQSTTTVTATVAFASGGGSLYGTLPVVGQIMGVKGTTAGSGNMNTAYAGLVQDVQDPGKPGAYLGREAYPLRFAA